MNKFLDFFHFCRLALPIIVRKEMCGALGMLSKLFERLHMEDVSQPVKASKGRRADTEPAGGFS